MEGCVKWFDEEKGLGLITPNEDGPSVFVAAAAIDRDGARTLSKNDRVRFDVMMGRRGPTAVNVTVVDVQ